MAFLQSMSVSIGRAPELFPDPLFPDLGKNGVLFPDMFPGLLNAVNGWH